MKAFQHLKSLVLIAAAISFSASAFTGCGFTNNKVPAGGFPPSTSGVGGSGGTGTTGGSGGNAVTFSEVNSQIFQPMCIQCHGSGANPDLSSYSSFATNTQWISPGNPGGSAVYNAVASGAMPQGGPALNSTQLGLLSTWIQEGAPND